MDELYTRYYSKLRALVARKIDDDGVVDEICNDIMLAAYNSWPNFNHECSEFGFIWSIAKHRIVDYYRKKKLKTILFSTSPVLEEIADKALSPERDVLKNELKEEIKKTLEEVGEGYQKILRLKYIDGLKINEIAKILGSSIKAVESKLIRAKKKFRLAWNYDSVTFEKTNKADDTDCS